MAEYIERMKLLDALRAKGKSWLVYDEINSIPAADVVPVRHGRWIEEDDSCCGFHATDIVCSECNKMSEFGKFSYCPNCGARMEG